MEITYMCAVLLITQQYHVLSGHASSKVVHKLLSTYFPGKMTMKEIEEMTSNARFVQNSTMDLGKNSGLTH